MLRIEKRYKVGRRWKRLNCKKAFLFGKLKKKYWYPRIGWWFIKLKLLKICKWQFATIKSVITRFDFFFFLHVKVQVTQHDDRNYFRTFQYTKRSPSPPGFSSIFSQSLFSDMRKHWRCAWDTDSSARRIEGELPGIRNISFRWWCTSVARDSRDLCSWGFHVSKSFFSLFSLFPFLLTAVATD